MASALPRAKVEDILLVNKAIRFLKGSSERTLKIWPIPIKELHLLSFSDAGGALGQQSGEWSGGKIQEPAQGAWLVFARQLDLMGESETCLPSVQVWEAKEKGSLHSFGETLALGEAVASVEWAQVFLSDILGNKVPRKDWSGCLSEYSIGIECHRCRMSIGPRSLSISCG